MAVGTCWQALFSFLKSLHLRHDLVSGGVGVGVLSHFSCVKYVTLCDPMDRSLPAGLLCPRDSPGKNTGMGCHALLQGIFMTQVSNPHL